MLAMCPSDAGASINTPNIGNLALIIEELDWGGQDALNTCENSFFGPHLGLGRQKNVIRLGQTPHVYPGEANISKKMFNCPKKKPLMWSCHIDFRKICSKILFYPF